MISDSIALYWDIENLNELDDHDITMVIGTQIIDMMANNSIVIAKEYFGDMQITIGPLIDGGSCEAQGLITCSDGSCAASIEDCDDLSNDLIPNEFSISMPYPNPFNPAIKLDFSLPETQIIEINIYNLKGEYVGNLMSGLQTVGHYSVSWNAKSHPTGIYFIQFISKEIRKTMKVMLVK